MKKQLFKISRLKMTMLGCMSLAAYKAQTTKTDSLVYTGGMQTYTVPCGVTSITIEAYGAQGGNGALGSPNSQGGSGGLGAYASGTLAVTPGQILNIYVGGAGTAPTGGFNGGGNGGNANAGGGGGATDVRIGGTAASNRVLVAGGGGGGGRGGCEPSIVIGGNGGLGGGGNGQNGIDAPTSNGVAGGGFGAIGTAGGLKGIGCAGFTGNDGLTATNENGANGGAGQSCCCFNFPSIPGGGGGGGGFIGGGGGGGGTAGTTACSGNDKGAGGGGAGGSSYNAGMTTTGTLTQGLRAGNGVVKISYTKIQAPTSIVGVSTMCNGTSTNYSVASVAGATGYQWATTGGLNVANGQGNNNITVSANGAFGTLKVRAYNSCGDTTTFTNSININVNSLPAVTANSSSSAVCAGSNVTLSGGGALSYAWTNGAINGVAFTPTATQTYTVTGTDVNGCSNTAQTTVTVNPNPNASITASGATICAGGTTAVTLNGSPAGGIYTVQSGVASALIGNSFNPANTGNWVIVYKYTDANTCSDTAQIQFNVNCTVGLDDLLKGKGDVQIFPNPNNGLFYIKGDKVSSVKIDIQFSRNITLLK
jgi:hypothetical protein